MEFSASIHGRYTLLRMKRTSKSCFSHSNWGIGVKARKKTKKKFFQLLTLRNGPKNALAPSDILEVEGIRIEICRVLPFFDARNPNTMEFCMKDKQM